LSKDAKGSSLKEHLPLHLTDKERAALSDLVDHLSQRYGIDLQKIVLFGSKARGDFDDESDLDVLIVIRMSHSDYWRRWTELEEAVYGLELKYDVVFSLLIKDETEYHLMRRWNLLINRSIEQDGIELWTSLQSEPSFN
jgi:predicted nucleotidyltransferase